MTDSQRLDKEVAELVLINPTVRAAMKEHQYRRLSLEDALKLAVVSLAKQNAGLQGQLTEWFFKAVKQ